MQTALYDPKRGYYTTKISDVGRSGDFSTTATLSDILGKALAHEAVTYFTQTKSPWNVIEFGAGSGALAQAFLKHLGFWNRRKLSYNIVEASPKLQATQKNLLGKAIIHHNSPKEALASCKANAFCFSNELVDAFPVRIFRKQNDNWQELFLEHTNEGFQEHFLQVSDLPESSLFSLNFPEGQRIEIHASYRLWLQETLLHLEQGRWITIDYGDIDSNIYHRRKNGTIRAYAHHQRFEGASAYQNPGHQDITCDVNFTDLINWGNECGLSEIKLQTQRDFLLPYIYSTRSIDHFLTNEEGAGSAFKVLTQEKYVR